MVENFSVAPSPRIAVAIFFCGWMTPLKPVVVRCGRRLNPFLRIQRRPFLVPAVKKQFGWFLRFNDLCSFVKFCRRTVRKEGPNCGRDFFGCSKPQGSSCNFFLWCDDAASSGGHQAPQIRQSNAPSNPGQVSCSCGNAAAK